MTGKKDTAETNSGVSGLASSGVGSGAGPGAGITELSKLLKQVAPVLDDKPYVFCSVPGEYADYAHLKPLCSFVEREGLTLILDAASARQAQLSVDTTYKRITLTVHSSLDAVGLTAAVATALTSAGISANVVAAYYHDHVFVQAHHADKAMEALQQLAALHRDS